MRSARVAASCATMTTRSSPAHPASWARRPIWIDDSAMLSPSAMRSKAPRPRGDDGGWCVVDVPAK